MAQNNATAMSEAMLRGPGLQPPPGVVPNFINPPSRAHWVYVTMPICLALTTPFVWIRLCTVFFILKSHGWADCMYNSNDGNNVRLTHIRYFRRCVGTPRRIYCVCFRCCSIRRRSPPMGYTIGTCHGICKSKHHQAIFTTKTDHVTSWQTSRKCFTAHPSSWPNSPSCSCTADSSTQPVRAKPTISSTSSSGPTSPFTSPISPSLSCNACRAPESGILPSKAAA